MLQLFKIKKDCIFLQKLLPESIFIANDTMFKMIYESINYSFFFNKISTWKCYGKKRYIHRKFPSNVSDKDSIWWEKDRYKVKI